MTQREEKTTHPSVAESVDELTRVLRCVVATETEPGRSGERGRRGDAEAAACESLPPPETPPGAGRLPEVGSGNFLQESQKSWSNILETPETVQIFRHY